MDDQFSDRVAIITGSAQGFGKAFATALLQKGCKVCISDVNGEQLKSTFTELKSEFGGNIISVETDVTNEQQLRNTFQKTKDAFHKIDIVVNNAGIVDEKRWEKCIDINLNGVIRGTLLGLEYMRKDKGGDGGIIINISSLAGIYPVNYSPAYSASKHGVIGYTRSWANHPDVQKNGVRLVCLCPAFADTNILNVGEDRCHGNDLKDQSIQKFGVMSVDKVTECFLNMISDPKNNGSMMSITKRGCTNISLPSPQ